jgi:hypothetical protein
MGGGYDSFPNVKKLILGGGVSNWAAAPFLERLRNLPLDTLVLEKGESISNESLTALVSGPTKHLTLRSLIVKDFVIDPGRIGTRVSTVDFDAVFRNNDPETADIVQDVFPDDWEFPTYSRDYEIEKLAALFETAIKNGVTMNWEISEALKVHRAFQEDAALIEKSWETWKKKQRKGTKKGNKKK